MNIELLQQYHKQGLSCRKIANKLNCHHKTVSIYLKKLGLSNNINPRRKIEKVTENTARCSRCRLVKKIENFTLNKSNWRVPYYLSYCNTCKNKRIKKRVNNNYKVFLRDRFLRLKRKAIKYKIAFDLDFDYFLDLWHRQEGRCFYFGSKIEPLFGVKEISKRVSVDKIIPEKGYTKGNVVFASSRANTCKNNLNLKELQIYMPIFYDRIQEKINNDQKEG